MSMPRVSAAAFIDREMRRRSRSISHDLYLYNVANLADLRWSGDVLLSHLGDVDEALNAVAKVNKCTEGNKLGDSALDDSVNWVLGNKYTPWTSEVCLRPREIRSRLRSTSRT